jgi:hypothetical protein
MAAHLDLVAQQAVARGAVGVALARESGIVQRFRGHRAFRGGLFLGDGAGHDRLLSVRTKSGC